MQQQRRHVKNNQFLTFISDAYPNPIGVLVDIVFYGLIALQQTLLDLQKKQPKLLPT
jgi:hypothetical protein